MKKTYVLTIDLDDEKVSGSENLTGALGLSDDRARELTMKAINAMEAGRRTSQG